MRFDSIIDTNAGDTQAETSRRKTQEEFNALNIMIRKAGDMSSDHTGRRYDHCSPRTEIRVRITKARKTSSDHKGQKYE